MSVLKDKQALFSTFMLILPRHWNTSAVCKGDKGDQVCPLRIVYSMIEKSIFKVLISTLKACLMSFALIDVYEDTIDLQNKKGIVANFAL